MLPPDDCSTGETLFFVLDAIDIEGESMSGVAPGFNLDGRVSDVSDALACSKPDFTWCGEGGIDNAYAVLLPILEMFGGDVSAAAARDIREGRLLLLLELANVNDLSNDACVELRVYAGEVPEMGRPRLNADETIAGGQTFDVIGEPLITLTHATLVGGEIRAENRDSTFEVPSGLGVALPVRDTRLVGGLTRDEIQHGLIGGWTLVSQLAEALATLDAGVSAETLAPVLTGQADMRVDGECRALSLAMSYSAVDAVRGRDVSRP